MHILWGLNGIGATPQHIRKVIYIAHLNRAENMNETSNMKRKNEREKTNNIFLQIDNHVTIIVIEEKNYTNSNVSNQLEK